MESARLSDAQVREQRNPLRVGEERVQLSSVRSAQIQCAERPELYRGNAAPPRTHSPRSMKLECCSRRLGNREGTVRLQVRTYAETGIVATTVDAARSDSNPQPPMRVERTLTCAIFSALRTSFQRRRACREP